MTYPNSDVSRDAFTVPQLAPEPETHRQVLLHPLSLLHQALVILRIHERRVAIDGQRAFPVPAPRPLERVLGELGRALMEGLYGAGKRVVGDGDRRHGGQVANRRFSSRCIPFLAFIDTH